MSIQEKIRNGKAKVKEFYEENKTLVKTALVSMGLLAAGCVGYAISNGTKKSEERFNNDFSNTNNEILNIDLAKYGCEWKEDYLETYNRVNEFAQTINLRDGESYVIERNSEYDDIRALKNLPLNMVSHTLTVDRDDGTVGIIQVGIYPPDDKEE